MEQNEQKDKSVFVTVGTTQFNPLTSSITTPEFLSFLSSHNYTSLTIQYGKGIPPSFPSCTNLQRTDDGDMTCFLENQTIKCQAYRFKPSLISDISTASLILSHAGAGSIMEGLSFPSVKKVVVVINSQLMNNHQLELAHAMKSRGYLFVLEHPEEVRERNVMEEVERFVPRKFEGGDGGEDFVKIVDCQMGFV
uniref:UDP-N-acetylglucosamine transferase subunit ALG13 n=1 Tax=Ditylum brightwellii TaxID=49249 RepID=A0A7S4R0C3_9STRA